MDADNSVHEQNHTSFNPKTDKIRLQSSTTVNIAKTPFEKHTKTSLPLRDKDMDVENSGLEQNHTSFKPKTEYLGRRDYTTLKKDKKSLEKHTKTSLPLSNEGDDHGQLEQKQNKLLSESEVVNRGRQVNLTSAKNAVTTKRKNAIRSSHASDHDMDDNNSGYEQTHSSCHPKAKKIRLKNLNTVKKANKPLENNPKISLAKRNDDLDVDKFVYEQKHVSCKPNADRIKFKNSIADKKAKNPLEKYTKRSLSLRNEVEDSDDDGNDEQEQHKKTTGRPLEKSEITTSKQNTKHLKKSSSKSKNAKEGKTIIAKEQHVDKPSSHRREGATVSVEEVIRHDQRHDEDINNTATSSQPVKSDSDDENKNDKYVYRVLRFDESYTDGIFPKDIHSEQSIEQHVLHGSKSWFKSRFISCCKTITAVKKIASFTNINIDKRDVVQINISKLNPKEVTVIDLTDNNTRDQHLQDSTALRYAQMYEEVILEPKICIPSKCIEKEEKFITIHFTLQSDIRDFTQGYSC